MWDGLIKTNHYKPLKQWLLAFSAQWNQPDFFFLNISGTVCPPSEINEIPWG